MILRPGSVISKPGHSSHTLATSFLILYIFSLTSEQNYNIIASDILPEALKDWRHPGGYASHIYMKKALNKNDLSLRRDMFLICKTTVKMIFLFIFASGASLWFCFLKTFNWNGNSTNNLIDLRCYLTCWILVSATCCDGQKGPLSLGTVCSDSEDGLEHCRWRPLDRRVKGR